MDTKHAIEEKKIPISDESSQPLNSLPSLPESIIPPTLPQLPSPLPPEPQPQTLSVEECVSGVSIVSTVSTSDKTKNMVPDTNMVTNTNVVPEINVVHDTKDTIVIPHEKPDQVESTRNVKPELLQSTEPMPELKTLIVLPTEVLPTVVLAAKVPTVALPHGVTLPNDVLSPVVLSEVKTVVSAKVQTEVPTVVLVEVPTEIKDTTEIKPESKVEFKSDVAIMIQPLGSKTSIPDIYKNFPQNFKVIREFSKSHNARWVRLYEYVTPETITTTTTTSTTSTTNATVVEATATTATTATTAQTTPPLITNTANEVKDEKKPSNGSKNQKIRVVAKKFERSNVDNFETECANLSLIQSCHFVPRLLYADKKNRIILMSYCGKTLKEQPKGKQLRDVTKKLDILKTRFGLSRTFLRFYDIYTLNFGKPSYDNLCVDGEGHLKLIDFGVPWKVSSSFGRSSTKQSKDSRKTKTKAKQR